jgi:hypothetical protein
VAKQTIDFPDDADIGYRVVNDKAAHSRRLYLWLGRSASSYFRGTRQVIELLCDGRNRHSDQSDIRLVLLPK